MHFIRQSQNTVLKNVEGFIKLKDVIPLSAKSSKH